MDRRGFLGGVAAVAVSSRAMGSPTQSLALPELESIIDTHVHFYDPTRPGGVPWPPESDAGLYRTVLPEAYRKMTAGLGIKGVIEVEASPLLEDNQWVLDLVAREPIMLGTCGDIEIGKPGFGDSLDRFLKSGRFYGIRIGNLWNRSLNDDLKKTETIANLKLLAQVGLEVDMIGGFPILPYVIQVSDQVPDLRIVVEHMPFDPPQSEADRPAAESALHEISQRPTIFSKVSNVLRKKNGEPVGNVEFYRPALNRLWEIFGIDRLVYGSNWPVSEKAGPYELVLRIVREYFATKGSEASRKFFAANSQSAYRWRPRNV